MEKLLICIPVVKNPDVLKECVNQIMYKRDVHIIILLNGADQDVKDLVYGTYDQYPQITVWENKENVYVTEAWNSFIRYFIGERFWERLIIMNSDLTLQRQWREELNRLWLINPNYIITPTVLNDKTKMYEILVEQEQVITELDNPPGIFITLNLEQCELVNPIPSEIRVWFNDSWIMGLLKAARYPIITTNDFLAFHHVSTSVNSIVGIHEVIEEDKIQWEYFVKPQMEEKIKQIQNGKTI